MEITQRFISAVHDYQYLLNRNYPQKAILKIIGDKHALSRVERSVLYRGICSEEEIKRRKSRLLNKAGTKEIQVLHIDTYNVLIIIGSYLNGSLIFISTDGFLRDASELHGRKFRKEIMQRAIQNLFDFLETLLISEINFYVDEPVSYSGDLCKQLQNWMKKLDFKGNAHPLKSPDFHLKKLESGVIATADSVVIDHAKPMIIDLPRRVLESQYSPDFLDLSKI